jgi:hypothetical protein
MDDSVGWSPWKEDFLHPNPNAGFSFQGATCFFQPSTTGGTASSLAFYNTCEDVDLLVNAIWNLKGGGNSGPI